MTQINNPHNKPSKIPKHGALTEILRLEAERLVTLDGEVLPAREALARAVWQFAATGTVRLGGETLKARSIREWATVIKWLYGYVEPNNRRKNGDNAPNGKLVVRVIREDRSPHAG